jgi:hypothetical protein
MALSSRDPPPQSVDTILAQGARGSERNRFATQRMMAGLTDQMEARGDASEIIRTGILMHTLGPLEQPETNTSVEEFENDGETIVRGVSVRQALQYARGRRPRLTPFDY